MDTIFIISKQTSQIISDIYSKIIIKKIYFHWEKELTVWDIYFKYIIFHFFKCCKIFSFSYFSELVYNLSFLSLHLIGLSFYSFSFCYFDCKDKSIFFANGYQLAFFALSQCRPITQLWASFIPNPLSHRIIWSEIKWVEVMLAYNFYSPFFSPYTA